MLAGYCSGGPAHPRALTLDADNKVGLGDERSAFVQAMNACLGVSLRSYEVDLFRLNSGFLNILELWAGFSYNS